MSTSLRSVTVTDRWVEALQKRITDVQVRDHRTRDLVQVAEYVTVLPVTREFLCEQLGLTGLRLVWAQSAAPEPTTRSTVEYVGTADEAKED